MRLGAPRRISAAQALGVVAVLGGTDADYDPALNIRLSIVQGSGGRTSLCVERDDQQPVLINRHGYILVPTGDPAADVSAGFEPQGGAPDEVEDLGEDGWG